MTFLPMSLVACRWSAEYGRRLPAQPVKILGLLCSLYTVRILGIRSLVAYSPRSRRYKGLAQVGTLLPVLCLPSSRRQRARCGSEPLDRIQHGHGQPFPLQHVARGTLSSMMSCKR